MVGGEAVGDRAAVRGGRVGERGDQSAAVPLELRRDAVGEHAGLSREGDGGGLLERVVEDDGDLVALVDAEHRAGVLEPVEPAGVAPHVRRVAVGEADVAGPGGQVEDLLVARTRLAVGADDADLRRDRLRPWRPAPRWPPGTPPRRRRTGSVPVRAVRRRPARAASCAPWVCPLSSSRSHPPVVRVQLRAQRSARGRVHVHLGGLPAEAAGSEVVRAGVVAVVEQVGVVALPAAPAATAEGRRLEDRVEALAGADVERLGLVRRVGAVPAPHRRRVPADDAHPDPGQRHRLLAEAQVREPQGDALAAPAGHQGGVRLVLQLRVAGGWDEVARGVVHGVERVDRAVGQQRVRVDAAVEQREVGAVVAPLRQLDVRVRPVRLGPHLGEEHRVLAVEAGRAVAVVVHVLAARVVAGVAVLERAHEDQAGHPHLHVLHVLDVAVVHVRPRVARPVDVGELAAAGHRHRPGRLAVEERDHVAEPVPVQGVRVEQVRPQGEPEVGQGDPEVDRMVGVELLDPEQRCRVLGVVLLRRPHLRGHAGDVAEPEDVRREPGRGEHVRVERRDGGRGRQVHPAVGAAEVEVRRAGRGLRELGAQDPALPGHRAQRGRTARELQEASPVEPGALVGRR